VTVSYWDAVYRGKDPQELSISSGRRACPSMLMTEAFRPESECWRSDAAQGNFTVRLAERKLMI